MHEIKGFKPEGNANPHFSSMLSWEMKQNKRIKRLLNRKEKKREKYGESFRKKLQKSSVINPCNKMHKFQGRRKRKKTSPTATPK